MYRLGLVSVSFRQHTPEQIIRAAKDSGLCCIEWGSDVHAPENDIEQLNHIAQLQEQYGISCCSYGTYFRLGVTPLDKLTDYINAAKLLGTDILRVWCSDKGSAEHTLKQTGKLFDDCRKAAQIAKEHNVKLCMECHNWTYTDTLPSALKLMKAVNSNHFRMYWQPNQFRSFEENVKYATEIADYTRHIHVFNWTADRHLPLEGSVDIWQQYLKAFGQDKTLLLEFMPDNQLESLKQEAASLYKIAGEKI